MPDQLREQEAKREAKFQHLLDARTAQFQETEMNVATFVKAPSDLATSKLAEVGEEHQRASCLKIEEVLSLQNEHTKLLERFNRQLEMLEEAV